MAPAIGTLFLVATPIGNLEDLSQRALRILREVPLIAAEDTRHTRKLLTHFGISTPMLSYHQHSASGRTEALLGALAAGDVALVSDAGTPLLSDPGQELVRAALAAGHSVVPIPGAAAAILALVGSGLPTASFTFLGFLPRVRAARRAVLEEERTRPHTLVLYESPHRLLESLYDAYAVLGDREAVVACELTKLHEQWLRGPLSTLPERVHMGGGPRGEYTLVIAGAPADSPVERLRAEAERVMIARALVHDLLARGVTTRTAAEHVSATTGLARQFAYRLALEERTALERDQRTDEDAE